MSPLGLIEKLINEHGSSTILKERLSLIQDRFSELEQENLALKEELRTTNESLAQAEAEVQRLSERVEEDSVTYRFVEYRGAKFRRKPSGGFEEAVYCPSCETGMVEFHPEYVCARCGAATSFSKGQLQAVLREVKNEFQ